MTLALTLLISGPRSRMSTRGFAFEKVLCTKKSSGGDCKPPVPSTTIYYVTRNNDPALLVLASLAEGDKHGYAMMEDIERFSSIKLGPGTLYGAITRLEESGWIAPVPSADRRQPYTLTALGRKSLENEIATLNDVLKTAAKRLRHA
jgi:DNA-binding PadR family transcriptional regulator